MSDVHSAPVARADALQPDEASCPVQAADLAPTAQGRRSWLVGVVVAVWAVAVLVAFGWLGQYAATPGVSAGPPEGWPSASALARTADRATLVMLVHPRCACSRASVAELERIMARAANPVTAHVLFVEPEGADATWRTSPLWDRVRDIPGVSASWDPGGHEAERFAARTSGQVVLYDASGALAFQGGITASRGHEGDSEGKDRILAALGGELPEAGETPVFGCALAGNEPTAERR